MKVYRRVIPKIAKDVVRTLLTAEAVEIEEGHRDDVELEVAGAIVNYLNELDQLNADARETIDRYKLQPENLRRVKQSLADSRQIAMGEGALDYVLERLIKVFFNSKYVVEIFAEDHELRKLLVESVSKYLGVDEELDREVRGRLRNLREGSLEWEVEYSRLIAKMRNLYKTA